MRQSFRVSLVLSMSLLLILLYLSIRSPVAQSDTPKPIQLTSFTTATARRLSNPAISPDGSIVAYMVESAVNSNEGNLFFAQTDGSGMVQPPSTLRLDFGRQIGWGGEKVVFVACDGCSPFLDGDVYVMKADGSGQTKLSTGGHIASSPQISADGGSVLFTKNSGQVFLAKTDGSSTIQLTNLTGLVNGSTPLPNADASEVLFLSYDGITFKLNIASVPVGVPSLVKDVGSLGTNFAFVLGSDGEFVVYTRGSGVSIIKSDGTGLLLLEPEGQFYTSGGPSVSADAGTVVYERSSGGGGTATDVFAVNADSTNKRNLSNTPVDCLEHAGLFPCRSYSPSVSHTGKVVAFLSNADLDVGKNADHLLQVFAVPLGAGDGALGFDYPISDVYRPTRAHDGDQWYVDNYFGHFLGNPPCKAHYHPGDDWNRSDGNDTGETVKAVANGLVIDVRQLKSGKKQDLGQGILIQHGVAGQFTPVYSAYVHVVSNVNQGDQVYRGQPIATIAPSLGFGPHLHFEIRTQISVLKNRKIDWYPHDDGCGYYYIPEAMYGDEFIDPVIFIDQHRP